MTKKLILAFGALGIISFFIPTHGMMMISAFKGEGMVQLIIMLAVFGVPIAMAAMAMSKPPMQKWQAIVSLASFAFGCFKLRIWETLPHIGFLLAIFPMFLMTIAAIGGTIVSIMGVVKGEESA